MSLRNKIAESVRAQQPEGTDQLALDRAIAEREKPLSRLGELAEIDLSTFRSRDDQLHKYAHLGNCIFFQSSVELCIHELCYLIIYSLMMISIFEILPIFTLMLTFSRHIVGLLACARCRTVWERDRCAAINITLKSCLFLYCAPVPAFWRWIPQEEQQQGEAQVVPEQQQ
jgi:hypothetical protein